MGMFRQGGPSPLEWWWSFCWELGVCGTRRLLGLLSCLSAPDLGDFWLVPDAAIWDLRHA